MLKLLAKEKYDETRFPSSRHLGILVRCASTGGPTQCSLRGKGGRAPGARRLRAAQCQEPAGRLLDSRWRLANRRQIERPGQATVFHGPWIRLCLNQLPPLAE